MSGAQKSYVTITVEKSSREAFDQTMSETLTTLGATAAEIIHVATHVLPSHDGRGFTYIGQLVARYDTPPSDLNPQSGGIS